MVGLGLGRRRQPDEHVDEPLAVDGRLAPERAEQRLGGEVVDHLLGVDARDRHQPEGHVGDGLGEHAADAEHHRHAELRVAGEPGDQLAVAA